MPEQLIGIIREYIEDLTVPYAVTDAVIERLLNKSRHYIANYYQIFAEDYPYYNLSRVYLIRYNNLMNVILKDGADVVITDTNYTIDVENGLVTFDAGYTIPAAVYAEFNYFDLMDTIAEIWKYRMALAQISGDVRLGDETLPKDKSYKEYCFGKYCDFKQSKNIQMTR
jgi:hypothetical protein